VLPSQRWEHAHLKATKETTSYEHQSASIDVYVSPIRPYNSPDPLGDGEEATLAPSSSTLISGPTEGILIDALLTFSNADEIAACMAAGLSGPGS
jgi:hypothetical protein